jgi:predicted deacylase
VSGYLERIDVHIGDVVKQGQVIAQIDPTDFLHKVREIEAKVTFLTLVFVPTRYMIVESWRASRWKHQIPTTE